MSNNHSTVSLIYRHIPYIPAILLSWAKKHPDLSKLAIVSLTGILVKAVIKQIKNRVPKYTVLEIDLDEKIVEHPQLFKIFGSTHALQELIDTIEFAITDTRVVALCVKVKTTVTLQLAQIQELMAVVERFKAAGKLAVIYADTFGELSSATRLYYLASAFNLIYVQQSGAVCLGGPSLDAPFVKHTLEKIGISPEISQRKLYKSFANMLTEDKLTPEHREMLESLMGDMYEQMIAGIAAGRKLEIEQVRAKLLKGIHSSTDALDGLVDGARYQDEVYKSVADHLKIRLSKANFLFWNRYLEKTKAKYGKKNKNKIALIYATGNIHRGSSNPLSESPSIGSDTLSATIRAAVKDTKVKAIIIRVDSGGGSYVASDSIYHEILSAKNAGKKVVVSMGNVAASGGYFIAMAADQIIAQPGTLTGSIGVLAGKFVTKEMWAKLGVTHDSVKLKQPNDDGSGVYNDYYSSLHSYTEGDYVKKREEILDYIYDDFTKKVAFSRKLNREQVEAAAQGRVWTGRQALELNLIDKLGGIEEAIQTAKALADIPTTATPFVEVYPKISLFNLVKPAKNREDADSKGIQAGSLSSIVESVSLVSNVAGTVANIINSYSPLLSSSSLSSPVTLNTFN